MNESDIERKTIESFCSIMNQNIDNFKRLEPPRPDYMFMNEEQRIGIEISQYINEAKQEEFQVMKGICESISNKLDTWGKCTELCVNIHWRLLDKIINFKNSKKKIINELVKIIQDNIPEVPSCSEYSTRSVVLEENEILMDYVDEIIIDRFINILESNYVTFPQADFVSVNKEIILNILEKKHKKLCVYKDYFDKNGY